MPDEPRARPARAAITAVAAYVPDRILTNAELSQRLDTSDEWIVTRTGIRERRIGGPGETTSMMGAEAVRRLMEARGLRPGDIDALIVATVTPDMLFPATACLIQDQLGLTRAWGFDLSAACSGFLYALTTGAQLVASGVHQRVVVVGADLMSSIIDPLDRTTAVLFGDGAGAALLEWSKRSPDASRGKFAPAEHRDRYSPAALPETEWTSGLQVRSYYDGGKRANDPESQ
jgi:3-oxoacyl-[acyl-carrier-protein] synthase-3